MDARLVNGGVFSVAPVQGWLPRGPLRILEVGCGSAEDAGELLAGGQVVEFVGVDLDEAAVASARSRWPQATFLCADAARLPEPYRGRFDVVLVRRPDVLAQPARWAQVFSALAGYLRPGGRVVAVLLGPAEASVVSRWLADGGLAVRPPQAAAGSDAWVVVADLGQQPLVWEDAGPAGVCDALAGTCSWEGPGGGR